jgi:hypothetical protein
VHLQSAVTRGFPIGFLLSHDCEGLDSAPPLLSVRFQSALVGLVGGGIGIRARLDGEQSLVLSLAII